MNRKGRRSASIAPWVITTHIFAPAGACPMP
nr:MAG TPA: hypothetical protein [Caudoviricetes sp.]